MSWVAKNYQISNNVNTKLKGKKKKTQFTNECLQAECGNIKALLIILLKEVARGINVSASVGSQLKLGNISHGPIFNAGDKPNEVTKPFLGVKSGQLGSDFVSYIEDIGITMREDYSRSGKDTK